jgi:NitT/TauT family transport system ATP-binding protein
LAPWRENSSISVKRLNTMLGMEFDVPYIRATSCLGPMRADLSPRGRCGVWYIFAGCKCPSASLGFADEMVSGHYGSAAHPTSFTMVHYRAIIIGMVTLGIDGYVTSSRQLHDADGACVDSRSETIRNVQPLQTPAVTGRPQIEAGSKRGVRIVDAVKMYGTQGASVLAVDHCTFDVPPGEITVVVGPSGCGKTTLLNAIAGFHGLSSGSIYLDDEMLCGPGKLKAEPGPDRIVVFQNGALFPWKTNIENVAFGPIMQGLMSRREAYDKARHMMADAGLRGIENNFPGEISSGVRRRVEIVRALMTDPKILLLDEPYRALDSLTKSVMHEALLEVFYKNRVTIFFITHDLEEAIFLGHRVVIMTTRPCRPKKILDIDIAHPRDYGVLTSKRFRELMDETVATVREEAIKAFDAGEKER